MKQCKMHGQKVIFVQTFKIITIGINQLVKDVYCCESSKMLYFAAFRMILFHFHKENKSSANVESPKRQSPRNEAKENYQETEKQNGETDKEDEKSTPVKKSLNEEDNDDERYYIEIFLHRLFI